MKNKFKKLFCTLALAFTMAIGSIVGLVSGIKGLTTFAEYKPTSAISNPYDFSTETGWTRNAVNNTTLRDSFTSSVSKLLKDLEGAYKPEKKYDGTDLEEERSLVMIAKDSPVKSTVDKVDKDGNIVYQTNNDGDFIFEIDSVSGEKKIYHDKSSDSEYVKVDGTENDYYKKVRETEEVVSFYSYKTTSSLTLEANNYYVLTAFVFTKNAFASVSIGDRDENFVATATAEDTLGTWKEIRLFVETSSNDKISSYITLYYGSKDGIVKTDSTDQTTSGAVIFDHIDVQKISKTEFNNKTIDGEAKEGAIIASDTARKDYAFDSSLNASFENSFETYDKMFGQEVYDESHANTVYQNYVPKYTGDNNDTKLTEKQLKNLHDAYSKKLSPVSTVLEKEEFESEKDKKDGKETFGANNHVLKIENKSEKYDLGVLTPFINISQFGYYRLSVFTKATDANAEAVLNLVSYIQTGMQSGENYTDGALQIAKQSVTAFTSDSDITNNWVEIAFYIQGNPYHDTKIQLALLAGENSTVYFDNMRLEAISSSTYSSATSATKFDLGSSKIVMNEGITNGYFNFITSSKTEKIEDLEKPYAPASWSKIDKIDDKKVDEIVSGVISTKEGFWNQVKDKIGNPDSNPIGNEIVNGHLVSLPKTNVLAMYATPETQKTFGYKSSSFSLSSSSVYEISFYTYAEKSENDSNFAGEIFANLIFSEDNIAEFRDNVEANEGDSWVKHTIVVRTGSSSRTLNIELGIRNAKGTVYFKEVGYKKLEDIKKDDKTTTVDDQFMQKLSNNKTMDLQKQNHILFVDYAGNGSLMHSSEKAKDKDYFTSLFYELEENKSEKVQGELGVVDTTKNVTLSNDPSYVLSSDFMMRPSSSSETALLIYNKVAGATTINPCATSSLSSSSYYQITFYVKTADIEEGKGLTALMNEISVKFENINTGALSSQDNEYVKYTVLVKTGSSSISNFKLSFMLGDKNAEIAGLALVSDIEIKKLENEKAYNTLLEDVDSADKTTIVKDFSASSKNNDETKKNADDTTLITFFLVFSSILLVGALIVAIVSVSIKRIPKNKTVVGTNNANVSKDKSSNTSSKDGFV